MANLSLRKITKRFGAAELFRDFDLDVRDGEFLCLLGPSGSGKTTLMRIIAGLEEIDGGDIFLAGREISRLAAARPPHRHDVSGLRALSAHVGARKPRLPAAGKARAAPRNRRARRRRRASARHRTAARSANPGCFRRGATAGRDRPRDRAKARPLPARRTDQQSRRQSARDCPDRGASPAAPTGGHHDHGHP